MAVPKCVSIDWPGGMASVRRIVSVPGLMNLDAILDASSIAAAFMELVHAGGSVFALLSGWGQTRLIVVSVGAAPIAVTIHFSRCCDDPITAVCVDRSKVSGDIRCEDALWMTDMCIATMFRDDRGGSRISLSIGADIDSHAEISPTGSWMFYTYGGCDSIGRLGLRSQKDVAQRLLHKPPALQMEPNSILALACASDNELYVGTSVGLYRLTVPINADTFAVTHGVSHILVSDIWNIIGEYAHAVSFDPVHRGTLYERPESAQLSDAIHGVAVTPSGAVLYLAELPESALYAYEWWAPQPASTIMKFPSSELRTSDRTADHHTLLTVDVDKGLAFVAVRSPGVHNASDPRALPDMRQLLQITLPSRFFLPR